MSRSTIKGNAEGALKETWLQISADLSNTILMGSDSWEAVMTLGFADSAPAQLGSLARTRESSHPSSRHRLRMLERPVLSTERWLKEPLGATVTMLLDKGLFLPRISCASVHGFARTDLFPGTPATADVL